MCEGKGKSQHSSPCTPEQIRECHGNVAFHPCEATGQSKPKGTAKPVSRKKDADGRRR